MLTVASSLEHAKRRADCNFFLLSRKFGSESQRVKGKGKKGRGSTASKASRMSSQSSVTIFSEAPSFESLGEPALDDESVLTAATTTSSTLTMPKSRGKRTTSTASSRKPSRSQKKKAAALDESQTVMFSAVDAQGDSSVVVIEPLPPTKKSRRIVSRTKALQPDTSNQEDEPQDKPLRETRQLGSGKSTNRAVPNENQLQSESHILMEGQAIDQPQATKPSRGTKRTSDGIAKLDTSVVMLEQPPEEIKPKKTRQTRKQPANKTQPDVNPETAFEQSHADMSGVSQEKAPAKAKRGKKATKAAQLQPQSEPEIVDTQMEDVRTVPHQQSMRSDIDQSTQETPVPSNAEPSPAPSTPTPARHTPAITRKPVPAPTPRARAPHTSTPSQSPRSSDAENKPPSSKPSAPRPPLAVLDHQVLRIPLASTPPASPSRRGAPVKITSTLPWSPADVERVLLASPVKAAYLDKENIALDGVLTGDKAELQEVVRRVKGAMTDEQRAMSVEEWVRWNAGRQAERLQRECEALVMAFEKEGGRAMTVLENIEAV